MEGAHRYGQRHGAGVRGRGRRGRGKRVCVNDLIHSWDCGRRCHRGVSPQVLAQVRGEQEGLPAVWAAVRFAGRVDLLVLPQPRSVLEALPAAVADMQLFVLLGMFLQLPQLAKLCTAGSADVQCSGVGRVERLVGLNLVPGGEGGVAEGAGELWQRGVGGEAGGGGGG